jgi:hypothetical protein
MTNNLQFSMPKLRIRLSWRYAPINVILRAETGAEYSISGFPRPLLRNESYRGMSFTSRRRRKSLMGISTEAASPRNSGTPASIRRRPSWTAPDRQRFPSLDALSLHGRFVSSSGSLQSSRLQSPSSACSAAEESPPLTGEPFELEAPSNHHNPRFQGAIQLQRERERIRSEEVAPLEERLRGLEARHQELENYFLRLQPRDIAGAADAQNQDEAVPKPVLGAGSSSSRGRDGGGLAHTATVRYRGRNPPYSGDSSSSS